MPAGMDRVLARHLRFATREGRRLGRTLFHAMARFGPKLEKRQLLLGRFVDIGTEIFAMTAACLRAQSLRKSDGGKAVEIADYFCRSAALRIEEYFHAVRHNADSEGYRLAIAALDGDLAWLEEGIV